MRQEEKICLSDILSFSLLVKIKMIMTSFASAHSSYLGDVSFRKLASGFYRKDHKT